MRPASAEKYAYALYSLNKEEGKAKEYVEPLKEVSVFILSNEQLFAILSSYLIPLDEQCRLIDTLSKGFDLPHLATFLKVVCKHHAMPHISQIAYVYEKYLDDERGIKRGLVYTPYPLKAGEKERLEKALGNSLSSEIRLDERLDPSLLGGVKIALDGKVYDSSLKKRLSSLREELLGK